MSFTPVSIERQIECVKREIAMRERVYPRWVQSGKMTKLVADDEIAAMKSALITLETAKQKKDGQLNFGFDD